MGAPISSNPNFGVSAASKASQVKAKCLTKEELDQILQHECMWIFPLVVIFWELSAILSSKGRLIWFVLFRLLGFYLTVVVCQQPRRPENSSRLQLALDADDILMPRQFL